MRGHEVAQLDGDGQRRGAEFRGIRPTLRQSAERTVCLIDETFKAEMILFHRRRALGIRRYSCSQRGKEDAVFEVVVVPQFAGESAEPTVQGSRTSSLLCCGIVQTEDELVVSSTQGLVKLQVAGQVGERSIGTSVLMVGVFRGHGVTMTTQAWWWLVVDLSVLWITRLRVDE